MATKQEERICVYAFRQTNFTTLSLDIALEYAAKNGYQIIVRVYEYKFSLRYKQGDTSWMN